MLNAGLPVLLSDAISCALDNFTNLDFDHASVKQHIEEFFITRARVMAQDAGHSIDAIEAVLAGGVNEPAEFMKRVSVLEQFRAAHADEMQDLSTAFARANNLRDEQAGITLDENALGAVEISLRDAVDQADCLVARALADEDYEAALRALAALRVPIDTFFEEVMIMDDDLVKRANRLALLNRFVGVFTNVADFSHLAK
jgi:glycyl-tRNA synthetase beta chain